VNPCPNLAPLPGWIVILSALLTPAIALAVGWISYAQYRINRNKLRLDLWERRYAIFTATMTFVDRIVAEGDGRDEGRRDFDLGTHGKEFLFGKDVVNYLKLLRDKSVDLYGHRVSLHHETGLPRGPERDRASQENADLLIWFSDQYTKCVLDAFEPYLGFGKIK
jgi:hypothetical protein